MVADTQTNPADLGCESVVRPPPASFNVTIHLYYYSARKPIVILPFHQSSDVCWSVSSTGHSTQLSFMRCKMSCVINETC